MYFIRKNVQKIAENQRRFGCIIKSLVRNIILASISPRKISAPFVKLTNCNQNLEKEASAEEYQKHLKRKENARAQKQSDKVRANDQVMILNFDLQKVFITSQMFVSDAYYSRKLANYNFTIYDMKSNLLSVIFGTKQTPKE